MAGTEKVLRVNLNCYQDTPTYNKTSSYTHTTMYIIIITAKLWQIGHIAVA